MAYELHVQLDVEVTFQFPDVPKEGMDDARHDVSHPFDCSDGKDKIGPFGLLVMADDALQEETALFFNISQSKDGRWATCFCSDQSRFHKLQT